MSVLDGLARVGAWFASASEVVNFGGVGFWIDFCSTKPQINAELSVMALIGLFRT
jgi:hypothetical protein